MKMAKRDTGKRRALADLTSLDFVAPKASDFSDAENRPVEKKPQPVSPREFIIPLILLGIGIVVLLVAAFALGGTKPAKGTLAFALTILFAQIPATIVVLYVVSTLADITYGYFWPAILKLAAITIFVEGLAFVGMMLGYPIWSRVVLFPVVWFLFSFLFELDFTDTFYSLVGMLFVSAGISWLMIFLIGNPSPVPT
jgi:hypothetical protein